MLRPLAREGKPAAEGRPPPLTALPPAPLARVSTTDSRLGLTVSPRIACSTACLPGSRAARGVGATPPERIKAAIAAPTPRAAEAAAGATSELEPAAAMLPWPLSAPADCSCDCDCICSCEADGDAERLCEPCLRE